MQRHAHRLAIFAIASVVVTVIAAIIGGAAASAQTTDVWDRVENRYADNDGVRVHYVTLGEGPLVVLIHGFPDFWYLWRDYRSGPRNLDSGLSEISIVFQAAVPKLVASKYTTSGVRRPSEL